MRIHDGHKSSTCDKSFTCEMCDIQFTLLSSLKNHMKVHSGKKPFVCKRCKKRFADKTDLEKHVQGHSSEKRLQCSECKLTFASKRTLNRHRRQIHTEADKKFTSNKRKMSSNLSWNDQKELSSDEDPDRMSNKRNKRMSSNLSWNDHKKESSSDDDPYDVLESTDMEEYEASSRHVPLAPRSHPAVGSQSEDPSGSSSTEASSRHPALAPRSHPAVGTQSEDPSGSSSTIEGSSLDSVNTRSEDDIWLRSFATQSQDLTKEETIECFKQSTSLTRIDLYTYQQCPWNTEWGPIWIIVAWSRQSTPSTGSPIRFRSWVDRVRIHLDKHRLN